ncbi:MAG: preprotein translocase subunit SecY [Ignavibacteriae bacterium]|nr:preprotein translocase subunit SecY [Ignavibacteriota bacterium]MCB9216294.1 preprotein translocase subunit SecY [Ignavibacteria bacterium]
MNKFFESLRNAWHIKELRERIIFTALMLLVVRAGSFIPLPGINIDNLANVGTGGIGGLFNMFVGGAYSRAAIFSLGIMPYISASIIIQLLGAVVPSVTKMQREGEDGRRTLNNWTRYITVALAFGQGMAIALTLQASGTGAPPVPPQIYGLPFIITAALVMTAGTVFLMWIGEQITEKGIGNGISLIIFIGIIADLPAGLIAEFQAIQAGTRNLVVEMLILAALLGVIAAVVMFTQAVRKIPVRYAKRQVGKRTVGGQSSHIPISMVIANVMPIIFAQALMFVPQGISGVAPDSAIGRWLSVNFSFGRPLYSLTLALMVVFFTFFYTAIVFSPRDVAENLRKQGGFIPNVRPGKPTEEYLDGILTRVTVPGSIFLAIVAILPAFAQQWGVSQVFAQFFGGTSLLIIIGVALDTLRQIESYLVMRHYDGFMKSGKLRGRKAVMG